MTSIKDYVVEYKNELMKRVNSFSEAPQLAIIQVGNMEASNRYIRNKIKDCEEVGIVAHHYIYENNISEQELIQEVKDLNDHYDGLIIQLPLPSTLRSQNLAAAINPLKDVDGFRHDSLFYPATPKGIMDYLRHEQFDLSGKDVLIIGRSNLVGKPLARMMIDADATVTLAHSKSKLAPHLQGKDLIVCAVGKAHFLDCQNITVPVIDVGINFNENGKMCGDCFNGAGGNVTPVPGGVGLLTRCALLDNVIRAKEKNYEIKESV